MSQYLRGKYSVVCGTLMLLEVYLPEAEVGFEVIAGKGEGKVPPGLLLSVPWDTPPVPGPHWVASLSLGARIRRLSHRQAFMVAAA